MIFVTAGLSGIAFPRLMEAAEALSALDDEIVVQSGSMTPAPRVTRSFATCPATVMDRLFRDATVVVCHAGVGSISASLNAGKVPVVMPRRQQFDEHVDDHQVALAERLGTRGLAVVVENADETVAAVARRRGLRIDRPFGPSSELVTSLRNAVCVRR